MMTTSFIMLGITGVWSFLVYLVFGLICAGIAKAIMPGKDPGGFWVTALIGIIGAYLGAYMRTILGISHDGEVSFFSPLDWIFFNLRIINFIIYLEKIISSNV